MLKSKDFNIRKHMSSCLIQRSGVCLFPPDGLGEFQEALKCPPFSAFLFFFLLPFPHFFPYILNNFALDSELSTGDVKMNKIFLCFKYN